MAFGQSPHFTRRKFLRGAATASAAAIAGRGIYSLLDDIAGPNRVEAVTGDFYKQEQYIVDNAEAIIDNGVTVFVPPIYNDVFTAKLNPNLTWDKAQLQNAQRQLEAALQSLERQYPNSAKGLTLVISWGLPYFTNYINNTPKKLWDTYAPKDLATGGKAVIDAFAFQSDPVDASGNSLVTLEDNHVAIKIRSDSSNTMSSVEDQLFKPGGSAYIGDILKLTSKRVGFAGRGFGTQSRGKYLALRANPPVAGADKIPDNAQLMMGFTSTQTDALGPDRIPSFETLPGVTDQYDKPTNTFKYFAQGCAMHLSHLYLNLDLWYNHTPGDYRERVQRMFTPRTQAGTGQPVTIPNGPAQVSTRAQVLADADPKNTNPVKAGHNSLLQQSARLGTDFVFDNYGQLRRKGMAIPRREDFNTLDDPFFWIDDGTPSGAWPTPNKAGLHFAVFVPSSDRFHRARNSMDGVFPDGTNLRNAPYNLKDDKIGFNSIMTASHRQNYLVPPRRHRSFPLAELL
jgi:hypothetical protein